MTSWPGRAAACAVPSMRGCAAPNWRTGCKKPEQMKDDEAIVWEFTTQLRRDHSVDDATYAKAVEKFGEQGVVDLIAVNGYYDVVAMTLNVARVTPPPGEAIPFKQSGL